MNNRKTGSTLLIIFLFVFLVGLIRAFSQDFYDINKIQEIKLYFSQPNWRTLLNTAATSTTEPYTFCRRVVINGVAFDSVGAKFKGNSSFSATRVKNPWHIELDNVKEQDYQGYKDIKLSNIFSDPSCVREALSYELMQPYTDLPRANFAKVWVNDTLIGLYTNVEAITKSFSKKHFYSGNFNVLVKGTPPSLMGGSGGGSSLSYLGQDSASYKSGYEIMSTHGWKQLIHLCDTLNNSTANVEKILDVDRALWMLGFNILLVNLDSYTGGFTQNYYLWRDENLRFNPIIWDVNMAFGSFNNVGGTPGGGPGGMGGTDTLALAKLDPFTHEANTSKPLISKLLPNARYRKMYIAHLRTMLNEMLKSGKYRTRGEAIRAIINSAVQNDPNNLSTYAQFLTNFYYGGATTGGGGMGGGIGAVPGIVSLMENKIKYLDTLAVMKLTPPAISNNTNTSAKIGDTTWVTAKVTGHVANGVFIGYRHKITDYFTRVVMYDDGLHRDGAANDGIFGIGLKMSTPLIEYYIWAENNNAGIFSPERAEHEFYRINSSFTAAGDVVINELMASNSGTAKDNNDQYDDWIELHNKSAAAVNIGGWYLSDDATKRKKWQIPANTSIPASGYLIVWADEDSSQNTTANLHANFKLSASGETVLLSMPDTTIVDQVTFGAQRTDFGYARRPNGTGNFVIQTPTFATNNNTGTNNTAEILNAADVKIFPNPAHTEGVTIQINKSETWGLKVFNTLGQSVLNTTISGDKQLDVSQWQRGIYLVQVGNLVKKLVIQ